LSRHDRRSGLVNRDCLTRIIRAAAQESGVDNTRAIGADLGDKRVGTSNESCSVGLRAFCGSDAGLVSSRRGLEIRRRRAGNVRGAGGIRGNRQGQAVIGVL
jgi:hypothetical protein